VQNPHTYKLACLISGRNFGDALIQSIFLKQLINRGFSEKYIVWTRPESAIFFSDIPNCKVITSFFPVGTNKKVNWAGLRSLLSAVRILRSQSIDVTLDMFGDIRERCLAFMISSKSHKYIGWSVGHQFNKNIRNFFGQGRPVCFINKEKINIYDAYQSFVNVLTNNHANNCELSTKPIISEGLLKIGLHPFASQECRLWPSEKWIELAQTLVHRGHHITVYGAPSEHSKIESIFGKQATMIRFFTGSIPEFINDLTTIDILVGLDSFSVHIASHIGLKTIVISGASHPEMWAPPNSEVVFSSGGCPHYPCMNKPKCRGTNFEYSCIKTVEVNSILRMLDKTIMK